LLSLNLINVPLKTIEQSVFLFLFPKVPARSLTFSFALRKYNNFKDANWYDIFYIFAKKKTS